MNADWFADRQESLTLGSVGSAAAAAAGGPKVAARGPRSHPWRLTFLPVTKALHIGKNGRSARSARVGARAGILMLIPCMSLHRGGTQHMSLSATIQRSNQLQALPCRYLVGTKRIVLLMECAPIHRRRTVEVDWM